MARALRLAAVAALVLTAGIAATWAARRLATDDRALAVTGTIEARQVGVSPKITGRIVELAVREGQPVERGQLIARLDPAELQADLRRAQAAVGTAEARRRDLEAGSRAEEIREAQAQLDRAQADLENLRAGSRAQEIEQARASLRDATVKREWTDREFTRTRELFAKDLVAAQEVDRARQGYESAVAAETAAREKLSLVEAGARQYEVEAARAAVRAAEQRLALLKAGSRPEAIAAARAQVAEARAAAALAQSRLDETRLVSPLTGVVLRKNAEAGETLTPGVSIVTLLDTTDLWLRAYVSETDIGRVKVGQPATISVDAFPGRKFFATVSEVSSEAEFTPKNVQTKKERVNLVFRVKLAVKDTDGLLKPGMPADAEILPAR
ncbi:MAG: efflux RND transporter periplasmic adaptor subunit [Candidatus Rokubacteria bacterium]|nr:efflux RND transporter periplasmic adaptor subunit [Candidatus Rokubacteria bacterium]MBI3826133.1 efflux RND transporter periplasmic adaptor subunit [Candidatus Rokubacteria bacterium]